MSRADELVELIRGRIHSEFDGECHLTDIEAHAIADLISKLDADYMRRHMDATDRFLEVRELRTALPEAEQRARREALEEAAKVAKTWIEDWGVDLQSTCDGYRDAITSGRHNGRRIPPEMAKTFAGQFKERSDAVYDCGEQVAKAIRALIPSEPHDAEGRP